MVVSPAWCMVAMLFLGESPMAAGVRVARCWRDGRRVDSAVCFAVELGDHGAVPGLGGGIEALD